MLMPFQWYIEGTSTELFLSLIWIACLLIPLGYWGAPMIRPSDGPNPKIIRMTAVPLALLLLYLGLVVVPESFGVTGAPLSGWLAAVIGIVAGGVFGLLLAPVRTWFPLRLERSLKEAR